MSRVLALDPGDRVGWARATIAEDGSWTDLQHGITPLKEMAMAVAHSMDFNPPDMLSPRSDYDLVICEEWRLFPHRAHSLVGGTIPSAQFIGMVKLSCWLGGVPLVMQPASVQHREQGLAPSEASMKKLRPELFELVMRPRAHDDAHDMSAIKHLWHYTFTHYPVTEEH